ncbi:hypothetical protein ONZ45_g18441 [Pleurotus djamor]|nr:hypothetical protein ONZ45_g18441 [Pleurotus djamor]
MHLPLPEEAANVKLPLPSELWLQIFEDMTSLSTEDLDFKLLRCQNLLFSTITTTIHHFSPSRITLSLPLVCKSWNTFFTPLLYNTVFLSRVSQIEALVALLTKDPQSLYQKDVGSLIKRIVIIMNHPTQMIATSDLAKLMSSCPTITSLHIFMHLPIEATRHIYPNLDSDLSSTSPQSSSDIPEQEDEMHLVDEFKRLHILQDDARFFGKSSSFVLLQTALGVKQECTDDTALRPSDFRRSEYWEIPEYERDVTATTRQTVAYTFPEQDLMQSVMDLYFKTSNLIIPLLHEPTFKAQVASGLHLRDEWFGSVLLTVFASYGSQFLKRLRCMSYNFTPLPYYIIKGAQIHKAVGLLVIMDRMVSAFVGRPCALHEEDYDVEYPLEVDDEYWTPEDPDLAFKQPPGTISKMTAFNLMLKLVEILAVALRALYSANKSRLWVGVMGPNWEQRVVSELDSELNSWLDSVPDARMSHPIAS